MDAVRIQMDWLPVALVFGPLVAAMLVRPIGRASEKARDAFVCGVTVATALGTTALIAPVSSGHRITAHVPALLGSLTFSVDPFSMLFALFAAYVWLASTLYSLDYMTHEHKRDRYHAVNLIVLAAMLGVVLAGDLITLYVFFEVLGLVAFLFVIHTETDEAKRAAVKYVWMTVAGGFMLIAGILLTFALGGSGAMAPLPAEGGSGHLRWLTALLLIAGFGVKAGAVPLHVWLPDAHPVAPSPASALLSGVMIKAGAYGIFRVVTALFRPAVAEHIDDMLWAFSSELGLVVLWLGVITMLVGVGLALVQSNAKRMLAYHSVSQMGFILAGIGAAGYLGAHGAMGVAGGLYHVVNHALFKACLFLGVGAVFFRTRSVDMYHLGGLWKRMPLTFVFTLVAAAGITGVPLLNGFVSKCLIHHAIVEAGELHGLGSLAIAEKLYIVTCGGTACSFIKLIGLVFLGAPKTEYGPEVTEAPPRMLAAMALLGAGIVTLGLFPGLLIEGVFTPGLHAWGLHADTLDHYLHHLFLSVPDLASVAVAFAIGTALFTVGMRTGLFHLTGPRYLSVDHWYRTGTRGFLSACAAVGRAYEHGLRAVSHALLATRTWYRRTCAQLSRGWRLLGATAFTGAPGPRDQHFVQHAYIALERERQLMVHAAIQHALDDLPDAATVDGAALRAHLSAVREVSAYMAQRVMSARMGAVGDVARSGRAADAVALFEGALPRLEAARVPLAAEAVRLAPARMRGENVLRAIASAVNRVLEHERLDLALTPDAGGGAVTRMLEAARSGGLTRVEQAFTWTVEMARMTVDALTRERSTWPMTDRLNEATIVRVRLGIQRYVRDIGLNVVVLVGVFLLFIAVLIG